ncbi:MAG: WG repeat-containing protein [Clostridiaceae bacterium]|nr:WG repeat-containing protein [Clostridiaceae bacterium]
MILLLLPPGCGRTVPAEDTSDEDFREAASTPDTASDTAKTPAADAEAADIPDITAEAADTPGTALDDPIPDIPATPASATDNAREERYLYPAMNSDGKWGYIDSEGKVVVDFIYDHAGFFAEGVAAVSLNDRFGLIDLDGETIVEPQYAHIGNFSEGLAHVVKIEAGASKHGFMNKDGDAFYKDYFDNNTGDFHDGLAVFEKDLNFGYVDTNGDIVIEPEYYMAYDFSEGLAVVADENDKHGFIDTNGNLVIPFRFDHYIDGTYQYQGFSNGLAAVCIDGKFGYINKNGDFAIEPVFDYAERFSDGLALVFADGLYGYIDTKGEFIIEPGFESATSFKNGFAFARMPGNTDYENPMGYALINKDGDFITSQNLVIDRGGGYTFISEWSTGFVGELARVAMMVDDSLKFIYIYKNGDIVWECE